MRHVNFVERAQHWTASKLDEHVNHGLVALVRTAYDEVPLYRQLMDRRGVTPDDIRDRGDLVKLPILTKDLVRQAAPEERVRPVEARTWDISSSGSTGENFVTKYDPPTEARCRALNLVSYGWGGWHFGAAHLQTGMSLQRGFVKKAKDVLFGCHYESAFDLTPEHLDHMADLLLRHRLKHIRGYPGSLYFLAKRLHERGQRATMASVLTWGDNLFAHYRELLEEVFQQRVTDVYGCGEGMLIASQCERGSYHVFNTDVVMEIVDEAGQAVGPGEMGHVLLTRLHPGPQPFLRYRVGDMARAGDGTPCPCGRAFETFDGIQGRDTDVILTPDGNRLIVHFFTGILEYFHDIEAFQVYQEELARCTVRVVAPGADATLEARVVEALRAKGADLAIDVERVAEIPPSPSGKRRFVISSLNREQGPT